MAFSRFREGVNGEMFVPDFNVRLSPNFGYVFTKDAVEDVITQYQVSTVSSFNICQTRRSASGSNGDSGTKRVYWRDVAPGRCSVPEAAINFDGIPYTYVGSRTYECHRGRDWKERVKRDKREKRKEAYENYGFQSKPRKSNGTKKVNCPAKLIVKEVIKYPDFKIPLDTQSRQDRASSALRRALSSGESVSYERRFYIYLPTKDDHKGTHPMGEVDRNSQRGVNKRLSTKDIIVRNNDGPKPSDELEQDDDFAAQDDDIYDTNNTNEKEELQQQCFDILNDIKQLTCIVNDTQALSDLKRSLQSCLEETMKKVPQEHRVQSEHLSQKWTSTSKDLPNKSNRHHPYKREPDANMTSQNDQTDMSHPSTSIDVHSPVLASLQNSYQIEQIGAIMTLVNMKNLPRD